MNYYYLIFLILLILSGGVFYNVVNELSGIVITLLGVVSIVAYLYYNFWLVDGENSKEILEWPSETYLKEVGAQCPNYWKINRYEGSNENQRVICEYVGDNEGLNNSCYDGGSNTDIKTVSFPRVKKITYPLNADNKRQEWMENCGEPWVSYEDNIL